MSSSRRVMSVTEAYWVWVWSVAASAASALAGTEPLAVYQSGATKKATVAQVQTFTTTDYTGAIAGLTGVGTLVTGTWDATTVDVPHGGSGGVSWTVGLPLLGWLPPQLSEQFVRQYSTGNGPVRQIGPRPVKGGEARLCAEAGTYLRADDLLAAATMRGATAATSGSAK